MIGGYVWALMGAVKIIQLLSALKVATLHRMGSVGSGIIYSPNFLNTLGNPGWSYDQSIESGLKNFIVYHKNAKKYMTA